MVSNCTSFDWKCGNWGSVWASRGPVETAKRIYLLGLKKVKLRLKEVKLRVKEVKLRLNEIQLGLKYVKLRLKGKG